MERNAYNPNDPANIGKVGDALATGNAAERRRLNGEPDPADRAPPGQPNWPRSRRT